MSRWPELRYGDWAETMDTLHLWTQIVGKIKLQLTPWTNHSWHVVLFVTPVGLSTGSVATRDGAFEIAFDFLRHKLTVHCDSGAFEEMKLSPMTVATFYERLLAMLERVGISVKINESPNEVMEPIPFPRDQLHRSYDADAVTKFHRTLVESDRIFKQFRARFIGKCSPVHFFWGSFDLAVTRFSGREAPEHPGGVPNLPDTVTREAYSHEVSSAGFWPGGPMLPEPVFYSYAYPAPEGFDAAAISPQGSTFHPDLREFVLPYELVRTSLNPDETLLEFLQTTYEAAANLASWDRAALERDFS